jgi:hypothetical protein
VVDDHELVGQVKDEVALVGRPLEPQPERLELKGQVVAEGAVQPQVGVVGRVEQLDQRAQDREDRRLLRALLLGEAAGRRADLPGQLVAGQLVALDRRQLRERARSGP